MPFPGGRRGILEQRSPIFVGANATITIPVDAAYMHTFLIAGGGSGGAAANSGGAAYGAGGGSGGALYLRVDLKTYRGNLPRNAVARTASFTIGSGGVAASFTGFNQVSGNIGGSSVLTLDGGFTVNVTGGGGGVADYTVPVNTGGSAGASSTTFYQSRASNTDGVISRPLWGAPSAAADAYTGDGGFAGGNAPSGSGGTGSAASSSFLTPWWLQAFGLAPGTGGAGGTISSNRTSGGGAAGWGGNGGAAKTENTGASATGNSGTGYGSGGGGITANGGASSTITSGAGAPGCAVIMFEVEV